MKGIVAVAGGVLIATLVLVACTSDHPQGPEGARPKESTRILMTLHGLVGPGAAQADLKLTAEEVAVILPVLKAWKTQLAKASDADTQAYAKTIGDALTDVQKAYRPQPPQGDNPAGGPGPGPGDGGPGAGPGPGGPGGAPDVGHLLDTLIQALS